jgi:hypothetical protein
MHEQFLNRHAVAMSRVLRPVLLAALILLLGCASVGPRLPEVTPFKRAVLLVYAGDARQCRHKNVAQSLVYLDLEPSQARTVTARAFDERDRPLSLDARSITWVASSNLRVEPKKGRATVRVTLLGGDSGDLEVQVAGHKGQLRVKKKQ